MFPPPHLANRLGPALWPLRHSLASPAAGNPCHAWVDFSRDDEIPAGHIVVGDMLLPEVLPEDGCYKVGARVLWCHTTVVWHWDPGAAKLWVGVDVGKGTPGFW